MFQENTPRNSALSKWDLVSESPTGGGFECACLLAFAYSDHNRSLIVFANEHDNYELVKLLILNTRVYWNYRVIRSLVFLLLVTMASKSTASPKRSTVDETPQTFRGSGGRFSKASPGNKNAKSQAGQLSAENSARFDALFEDFENTIAKLDMKVEVLKEMVVSKVQNKVEKEVSTYEKGWKYKSKWKQETQTFKQWVRLFELELRGVCDDDLYWVQISGEMGVDDMSELQKKFYYKRSTDMLKSLIHNLSGTKGDVLISNVKVDQSSKVTGAELAFSILKEHLLKVSDEDEARLHSQVTRLIQTPDVSLDRYIAIGMNLESKLVACPAIGMVLFAKYWIKGLSEKYSKHEDMLMMRLEQFEDKLKSTGVPWSLQKLAVAVKTASTNIGEYGDGETDFIEGKDATK